jgi:hypothetical protein
MKNTRILMILIATLVMASVAQAATIEQTTNNLDWMASGSWGADPTAGNDYKTKDFTPAFFDTLRINSAGSNFAGDFITLVGDTRLLLKYYGAATPTVSTLQGGNGNLVCQAGSKILYAPNAQGVTPNTTVAILDIGQLIAGGNFALESNLVNTFKIAGTLTGTGNVRLQSENDNSPGANSTIITLDAVSNYTGVITVANPIVLDFDSDVTFGELFLEAATTSVAGRLNVDKIVTVNKVTAGDTVIAAGTYSGASLTALGANFIDGGGTLVVVPEPATMILLALGGLVLKKRR